MTDLDHEQADEPELFCEWTEARRRAAHHEGGHIAVAWALSGVLYGADIVREGPFNGRAIYGMHPGSGASLNRATAALAGPIANRRIAPTMDDCGAADRERVEETLDLLCRGDEAKAIVRLHCEKEAARLVSENWDAVEAIAAGLIERGTLTGDEVNDVLADVEIDRANAREPARRRKWREFEARTDKPTAITESTP